MTTWHRLSAEEALQSASATAGGLTTEEAGRRLAEHGPNELTQKGAKNPWRILLEQFTSLLIIILIVAAVVSAALGDLEDAIAIVAIVVLNALLGFRQEYRAEKTMAALRQLAAPIVRIRRDGRLMEVPAREVVVGDIVAVEAGALVPADARLIHSASLRAQESALTGESEPVEKTAEPMLADDAPLADRVNMIYLGTSIAYGRAEAVVTATGMDTELGKIADMIQGVEQEPTPLQKRLGQLGRWLAAAALILVAIIFAQGLLRGEDTRIMFLTAVSMAVAAVPEGLPAIVTISLSLGAQRMLRRHALIRKLPAVETLGSVTVICSDKTGTLTENRMTVAILDVAGDEIDMYQAVTPGECSSLEAADPSAIARVVSEKPAIGLLAAAAALCNDSTLVDASPSSEAECGPAGLRALGDPTEGALVVAAAQLGLAKPALEQAFPRRAEIPFESDRKLMTTVHSLPASPMDGLTELSAFLEADGATHVGFTKGALDSVLRITRAVWDRGGASALDHQARERVERANDQLAARGMRVLAVAFRPLDDGALADGSAHWEKDLILVGLVGMIDPPRTEAREAVMTARLAGIRPAMITGDQPLTAASIAADVGIIDAPAGRDVPAGGATVDAVRARILTGLELDQLSPEQLTEAVEEISVYARVAPEQKLKIVEALQGRGHIVAMTGDGVNDAPALRKANIGVAMGITGTDVAKEAADMVLLDDNFATIVAAVKEGRTIYDNVRKFIKYLMATNVGELAVMLVAPFLGMPLPLLPLQILWMNLVTDGLPGLALGFEPAEPQVMKRPPHRPNESIFARGLGTHIIWAGPFMGVVALMVGWLYWRAGIESWQTMLFTVLTIEQMFHVLAIRLDRESIFTTSLRTNPLIYGAVLLTLLLQFALLYVPQLQNLFGTQPLDLAQLLIAIAVSSAILWVIELQKLVERHRGPKKAAE